MADDIRGQTPGNLNALIARIYEGVLRLPFAEFKEQTLRVLREVLAFDSGVWASGAASTNTIHSVALVDHSPDMLMAYAMRWQDEDFVRAAAVAAPGQAFRNEDVMALADYHATAIYREFSSPAGIEHALGVVHADPVTDLGEMLFLFRADAARPYSDAERELIELLLPHLVTAWLQRQTLHLHETRSPGAYRLRSHAVIDDQGLLQSADDEFRAVMRQVFPDWTGPLLPQPLLGLVEAGGGESVAIAGLDFALSRGSHRSILSVSARDDRGLTPAEARVARLFADGASNGEVAAKLGVSPATVRNQLTSIYRKLDIHSKAELARIFPPSA